MRIVVRDLLAACLVLLLVMTGIGLVQHDGRVAAAPPWALCGGNAIAGIPAPDAPTGHPLCLDCLAPAIAAAVTPLTDRGSLPVAFVVASSPRYAPPAAPPLRGPAIRAPPVPV